MTFDNDNVEPGQPGYAPPVSATKRLPIFTSSDTDDNRPFAAHQASPAEQRRRKKAIRQARDGAQYTRQQKGHSFLLHWLVLGVLSCFIVPIYYSVSPNHYWHL